MEKIYFVSGIDTDAGKSYATGWLARQWASQGHDVITQKFVQTGNQGLSDDIALHRRIMGTGLLAEDLDHTTAPVIFSYPCSPHLAARIDRRQIDLDAIDRSTALLAARHDTVLVEGAGGLMVPLTDDYLTIDYIESRRLPLIFVTHGALGSISHTLLGLEAIKARGIPLPYILYNTAFDSADTTIAADTRQFLEQWTAKTFPATRIIDVPRIDLPQNT
ncbi:MAG: dethiobiotin synthase [Muribaculaceae bacterium]|nr:dethiobiotin synthase [Muribaculaceae bacterium]